MVKLKTLIESVIKQLFENSIGYYGSTQPIEQFDLRKVKEFGIHIALEKPDSSLHRINHEGGYLYQVFVDFENPINLPDVFRWTLESVLRELKISNNKIKEYKIQASSTARRNGTNLREEENVLLAQILTEMGYDSIVYDNKGESGGPAVIVWNPNQIKILKSKQINKVF